ncbi:TetR/AcrR family transcriptional regulator C-terminal domain-containing protein [Acetivibrio clariflavus]|uniref:Transcriptional regulator n=1 Tax=Acetivibrio clariflavus (strain DSM 19732 / NBRC 101661 / EBR45) TaxID=720554 RepID=G8M2N2_ACECE|nr:TetR/AcrR family transcriptional regulator C-terminal domain-containing protein [Acetivibrio clariflavus]AEV67106.1 transcriptional regulator [Acetivibrio clariflavus DSM 19732]
MSKPELTKKLIADTLKKLMANMNLDKITVQDIVNACGLNRKTFYYHFKDKQDLVCWIFDTEFAALTDLNQDNSVFDELVEHLYKNREFYVAALSSDVQNNLKEHFFEIIFDSSMNKVKEVLGANELEIDEIKLIASFFSNGIVGSITQWAKEGMKSFPYQYSAKLYPITEECIKFIVNRYLEKKEEV